MSWIRGIDVSQFQGKRIPWLDVKAMGVDFAYMRCHHGNDHGPDPHFAENVRGARGAGVRIGAYCVAFPLPHLRPIDQVRLWQSSLVVDGNPVGELRGELPVAIDLEWPPPHEWDKWKCSADQIVDWTLDCLAAWSNRPIVYSYPHFLNYLAKAKNAKMLAAYELWIAGGPQYKDGSGVVPNDDARPPKTAIWGDDWTIWQHDGDGGARLPHGVDADFNVYNGDADDLAAFCGEIAVSLESDAPPVNSDQTRSLLLDFELGEYRRRRDCGFG